MPQDNPDRNTNGWSKAEMYVLEELKRIAAVVEDTNRTLNDLRVDVARKGAMWGAITGGVVTLLGLMFGK